jgi:hypothetical protein
MTYCHDIYPAGPFKLRFSTKVVVVEGTQCHDIYGPSVDTVAREDILPEDVAPEEALAGVPPAGAQPAKVVAA